MNNLITKNFNGNNIEFKVENGVVYANANKMAEAFGGSSKLKDWKGSPNTQRYIGALSDKIGKISLINSSRGISGGTWIHEKLILNFARYLDVNFELWCDEQIATLLREGTVSVSKNVTSAQLLLEQAQLLVVMEDRMATTEENVSRIEEVLGNTVTSNYLTVAAYANLQRLKPTEYNASAMGKRAKAICDSIGIEVGRAPDIRWGMVNTYPIDILDGVFAEVIQQ
jgi:KilA-N domain.